LVLGLVKRYLTVGAESNPYDMEARQARERAETLRRVLAMLSPPKRLAFKIVMNYADHYFLYRENQRFYLDMIFQRWRRAFRAIGRQFVERGLLATLEDIFMLRVDEVTRIVEEGWDQTQVQETVAERRAEYAAYARSLPPSFMRGNVGFEDAPPDATGPSAGSGQVLLQGLGASPGAVTAPARVLHDLSEAATLLRGEILVTVATDPGWTPLFVGAGGLVLETGGMLSHGAIVSREYGIPAVTGVRHATQQIQSGQVITVDGNRGHIRIHDA
jgi:pyruvate,water dikinase